MKWRKRKKKRNKITMLLSIQMLMSMEETDVPLSPIIHNIEIELQALSQMLVIKINLAQRNKILSRILKNKRDQKILRKKLEANSLKLSLTRISMSYGSTVQNSSPSLVSMSPTISHLTTLLLKNFSLLWKVTSLFSELCMMKILNSLRRASLSKNHSNRNRLQVLQMMKYLQMLRNSLLLILMQILILRFFKLFINTIIL